MNKLTVVLIVFLLSALCIILGLVLSMAVGESEGLRLQIIELQGEVENRQELIGHSGEGREISDLDESDKAMMEVIKKIAEIDSANITIETPEAYFHIEWERE